MVLYSNGRIPAPGTAGSPLFVVASGTDSNGYWEFQFTAMTWRKWLKAKAEAERRFGRTIHIRSGWNVYRPYAVQQAARIRACNAGNCNGASVAGYSSHGGNWGGRDCLAIDVNPNGLSWAQMQEACKAAGFAVGLITEKISGIKGGEPWHIIDFDAFVPVPAGGGSTPFDPANPIPLTQKEDDMPIFIRNTARGDYVVEVGKVRYLGKPGDILNVLRDPEADGGAEEINIISIKDQDLDAVLFGLGGISPEEIAVLPPGATWVDQKLISNPWINYGDTKHTQEIVLRSLDTKLNAVLALLAPERLAQIQADTVAAVDAALADDFDEIPAEVREWFKTDPLR